MKIQSNGMGMQSVAMYLMSDCGELPKFLYSIFADPGAELNETYEYLNYLKKVGTIPIIHDTSKNLYDDIMNKWDSERVASIPAFTENGGLIFRQCTDEYKIQVVNRNIKKLKSAYTTTVDLYIGISYDEMQRVFKPNKKNIRYIYPFCDIIATKEKTFKANEFKPMTRAAIKAWLYERGFKIPVKSSCSFCPYHSNAAWREIKKDSYAWAQACQIDDKIRNKKGLNEKLYLHRSLKPLREAYLQEDQQQLNFDCYGFCDV